MANQREAAMMDKLDSLAGLVHTPLFGILLTVLC